MPSLKRLVILSPILLVNFIGSLGFSIVIPFLVVVVTQFGGNAFMYGLVAAMYPLFQLIGAPLLGNWSDSWGRRPILLISQLGTLFSWIVFLGAFFLPVLEIGKIDNSLIGTTVLTLPLLVLGLARALDGLTGGNISVAQAYMADISNDHNRKKYFGWFQMAGGMGFMVGPALAGILSGTALGEKLPVMAAILISLVTSIIIVGWLPEPKQHKKRTKNESKFGVGAVLKMPKVGFTITLYLLLFMAFNIYYTAFPLYAINTIGWSVGKMGMYFAVLSLLMALVQGPGLQLLSDKVADTTLITTGQLLLVIQFLLIMTGNQTLIFVALIFFALGNGFAWPSLLAYLSKIGGDKQGAVHGVAQSSGSLASIIGLLVGGVLFGIFGSMTFIIPAVLLLLVAGLSLRLRE